MKEGTSPDEFHIELMREVFDHPTDTQVLCMMLLLHTCIIRLTQVAQIAGGATGFDAITASHAAEVAASLFSTRPKSSPEHWEYLWNGTWEGPRILSRPPKNLLMPLLEVKKAIEAHPWVYELVDDDWELLERCGVENC